MVGRSISAGVGVSIAVTVACGLFGSHPSDARLERVFVQRRSDFETLASMAEQEPEVVRIARDFTWLKDNAAWPRPDSLLGLSHERWDQYRHLFLVLGLDAGVAYCGPSDAGVLLLIASAKGLMIAGSEKGYAFSRKPLECIEESLDAKPKGSVSGIPTFKHLDGNWYLYFMWDD